jgi:hypothetical protein
MNHSHTQVFKTTEIQDHSSAAVKSSLKAIRKKLGRNIKNYHVLQNIDQEINKTLHSFQRERDRQHGVINAMREALIERNRPILKFTNTQLTTLNQDEMKAKAEKYKAKAKRLKLKVVREKSESCKLLRLANNYETEVHSLKKTNNELKEALKGIGEVRAGCIIKKEKLKVRNMTNKLLKENSLIDYKDKLKQILKDANYKNTDLLNSSKETLDELHNLVLNLVKNKKTLETKYTKLLKMYKETVSSKENKKEGEVSLKQDKVHLNELVKHIAHNKETNIKPDYEIKHAIKKVKGKVEQLEKKLEYMKLRNEKGKSRTEKRMIQSTAKSKKNRLE